MSTSKPVRRLAAELEYQLAERESDNSDGTAQLFDNRATFFDGTSDTILDDGHFSRLSATALVDGDTLQILEINNVGVRLLGRPVSEILGQPCSKFFVCGCEGNCRVNSTTPCRGIEDSGDCLHDEHKLILKEGGTRPISKSVQRVKVDGKRNLLVECFVDISELKHVYEMIRVNNLRFEALYRLSQMNDATEQELLDHALEAAVSVTKSKIGYIYFVDEEPSDTELRLYAWSKDVMPRCRVSKYPDVYKLSKTGLWGEAVRRREAVITNNYEHSPLKRGIPEGHVPVTRHLNLPFFRHEKIVLLIGVGNKRDEYTQDDVRQLSLVMDGAWRIVERKRAEDALKKTNDELEQRVRARTRDLQDVNAKLKETIRKQEITERELEEQRATLDALVESTEDFIWFQDKKQRLVLANDAIRNFTKNTLGFVLKGGERLDEVVRLSENLHILTDLYERALTGETAAAELEAINNHYYHFVANPLRRNDHIVGVSFFARDTTERKRNEEQLKRLTDRLALASNAGGVGVWEWNLVTNELIWDDQMHRMYKADPSDFNGSYEVWISRIHPDDLKHTESTLARAIKEGSGFESEYRIIWPDGEIRYINAAACIQNDKKGKPNRMTGINIDITHRKNSESDRQRVFELSYDMLAVAGFDGHFKELNSSWTRTLGWSEEELKGRPWIDFVHEEDKQATIEAGERLFRGEYVVDFENRYVCMDGSYRWLSWCTVADPGKRQAMAVARDVTDKKEMVRILQELATTDPLTGAPNRRAFTERFDEEIRRCRRYKSTLSLLMIDIDYFKRINDNHGHDSGDMVLKSFVEMCRTSLRETDFLGRLGGEEFGVLCIESSLAGARTAAERLRRNIESSPTFVKGLDIRITVSIGVSSLESEDTANSMMNRADQALYDAKRRGRNRVV